MANLRRITDDGLVRGELTDFESLPRTRDVLHCDSCGGRIEGEPAGSGLYLWTRGEEVRYEEPPLCAACARVIGLGASLEPDLDGE